MSELSLQSSNDRPGARSNALCGAELFWGYCERRWFRCASGFLIWTCIGLIHCIQLFVAYKGNHFNMPWPEIWPSEMAFWYGWWILSLPVFRLSRRYRLFEPDTWRRRLLLHTAAAIGLLFVHLFVDLSLTFLFYRLTGRPAPKEIGLLFQSLTSFFTGINYAVRFLIYWTLLLLEHALFFYRRYQQEELRRSELQSQLARAHLQALKMQLQPHFLFNTLNSISALLHQDLEAADRMIARLGDFLRMTLDQGSEQLVLLSREIEFARCYLAIEQIRFRDRLTVQIEVCPDTAETLVPTLILQPLVENAMRHGIAMTQAPGRVDVRASRSSDRLRVEISDNGPGLRAPLPGSESDPTAGVGFANTRARLQQLYGDEFTMQLIPAPGGGLTVRLEIPLLFRAGASTGTDRLP